MDTVTDTGNDTLVPMVHHEKARLRAAAFRAKKIYPGPVGELVSRELLAWEDFGYRLGGERPVMELVDHVIKATEPHPAPAATQK